MGGAIAPVIVGPMSEALGAGAPYWFGAAATGIAMIMLGLAGRHIAQIGRPYETPVEEAQDITSGDA